MRAGVRAEGRAGVRAGVRAGGRAGGCEGGRVRGRAGEREGGKVGGQGRVAGRTDGGQRSVGGDGLFLKGDLDLGPEDVHLGQLRDIERKVGVDGVGRRFVARSGR